MELLQQVPGTELVHEGGTPIVRVLGSAGVALDEQLTAVWQHPEQFSPDAPEVLALRRAGLLLPPLPLQSDRHDDALPDEKPLVSVIIVSKNGRHHLEECLPSLAAQTYTNMEIILVDDASTDDTLDFLQTNYPHVQIIAQKNGPNFAAGNNLGIRQAQGELILLLNNDTVLDPACLQELVTVYQREENVGGVAGMLRFYNNRNFINGLGSRLRRFGFGHDVGIGSLDVGQFESVKEIPLLCFGIALIPRAVLDEVGLIEEMYQFYYEDADWSYRARALGYRLVTAPRAIAYHKFSASTSKLSAAFKKRLATRNRLWFVLKNFPLWSILGQMILYGIDDVGHFLAHLLRGDGTLARAILAGWGQYLTGLVRTLTIRQKTWHGRSRQTVHLFNQDFPMPAMHGAVPRMTKEMVETEYKPYWQNNRPDRQRELLIISPDSVHSSMGGVGIRYWELAHQLADVARVTLAIPNETDLSSDSVRIHTYESGKEEPLQSLAQEAEVLLISGFTFFHHPFLRDVNAYRIIDLYDPMVLENLERFAAKPMNERLGLHQVGINTFNDLFAQGDFFICASEKQRDYWLGALTAVNRITPEIYDTDPTLRRLIDLVPFGIPTKPPRHTKPVLKGVRPGIGKDDKVILWGGGLWDWLDPLTLVEAMPLVLEKVPEARLFFLGIRHPNPAVPVSRMAETTLKRAEALGLLETAVFYNEWTPYEDRENYLCEADVGVSLHGDHIETRFAVRTRLMDYLWARLPMVVNGGDVLSDLVREHGLGDVVAVADKTAVAVAIINLLQRPAQTQNFEQLVTQYYWSTVANPLRKFVHTPWYTTASNQKSLRGSLDSSQITIMSFPKKVYASLKKQGIKGLWQDTRDYLRWISHK